MKAWISGNYYSGSVFDDTVWGIIGVYSSKEKAMERCTKDTNFIWEIELDEQIPCSEDDSGSKVLYFPDFVEE